MEAYLNAVIGRKIHAYTGNTLQAHIFCYFFSRMFKPSYLKTRESFQYAYNERYSKSLTNSYYLQNVMPPVITDSVPFVRDAPGETPQAVTKAPEVLEVTEVIQAPEITIIAPHEPIPQETDIRVASDKKVTLKEWINRINYS